MSTQNEINQRLDPEKIARDLVDQGWDVKLIRPGDLINPGLYRFKSPTGDEFNDNGFYELMKRLGGSFYNDYAWSFCAKIFNSFLALCNSNRTEKRNAKFPFTVPDNQNFILQLKNYVAKNAYTDFKFNDIDGFKCRACNAISTQAISITHHYGCIVEKVFQETNL